MESVGWFVSCVLAGLLLSVLVILTRNKGECPPGWFAYVGSIIILSASIWMGLSA